MRNLILLLLLSGCFGTGDAPTSATEATILLSIEPPVATDEVCNVQRYIGNVSIGDGVGFAVTHAYLPICQNGAGGNPNATLPATIYQFPLDGSAEAMDIATAGMVGEGGGVKPRVLAAGDDVIYTLPGQQPEDMGLASKSGAVAGNLRMPGATSAASLAADASHVYLAAWNQPGANTMVNHPRFPCCGGFDVNVPQLAQVIEATRAAPSAATSLAMPKFYCEQTSRCLVASATSLFYFEHGAIEQQATISSVPIAGGAPQMIASFGRAPTSLAANENFVVWSTSIDYRTVSSGIFGDVPESCAISIVPLRAPFTEMILMATDRFSCMDVALDGDDIYFTITKLDRSTGDGGVIGSGFGHITAPNRGLETLSTGITSIEAGPRSLFVAGDRIIGVGPLVVASFPKHAIDGRLDFVP